MTEAALNFHKSMILNHAIMCAESLKEVYQEKHRELGHGEQGQVTPAEVKQLADYMMVILAEFNTEQSTIQQDIQAKLREL